MAVKATVNTLYTSLFLATNHATVAERKWPAKHPGSPVLSEQFLAKNVPRSQVFNA